MPFDGQPLGCQNRDDNEGEMSIKAMLGDVFLVPVSDEAFGIGQVAGDWKGELYLIIYDATYPTVRDAKPQDVCRLSPLLSALSLDAKIYNGDWPIIGSVKENLGSTPQPAYKVEQGGHMYVESRDRTVTRIASDEEESVLRFRNVVAPIRIENALKALRGFGEWNPRFDELRANYAEDSSKVLGEL